MRRIILVLLLLSCLLRPSEASTRNIQDNYQFIYHVLNSTGYPISGQTATLKIKKVSNGDWFDFDDSTFKASGWTAKTVTLIENATEEYYHYTFNPPASESAPEQYMFLVDNTNATYKDHQSTILNYQSIGTSTFAGGAVASVTGDVGGISGITFPGNFSSFLITTAGKVTIGTNDDKIGYSLAADQSIVTFGNLTNKSGFTLASGEYTNIWNKDISAYSGAGYAGTYLKALWDKKPTGSFLDDAVWTSAKAAYLNASISSRLASADISLSGGAVTVGTNNDKTGYSLTADQSFVTIGNLTESFTVTISADDITNITGGVWNGLLASYNLTNSFGNKVNILPTSGTGDWTAGEKTTIKTALGVDDDAANVTLNDIGNYTNGAKENGNYTGIEELIRRHR